MNQQTELENNHSALKGGWWTWWAMWLWNRSVYLVLMGKINSTLKKIEQAKEYLEILKEIAEEKPEEGG